MIAILILLSSILLVLAFVVAAGVYASKKRVKTKISGKDTEVSTDK